MDRKTGDVQDTQKSHTGVCGLSSFGLSAYRIRWEQRPIQCRQQNEKHRHDNSEGAESDHP